MNLKLLKEADLTGKRVLVRLDLNVSFREGQIEDTYRIERALPTVKEVLKQGGFPIILSHNSDNKQSLKPVAEFLAGYFKITFIDNIYDANQFQSIGSGNLQQVYLCENLRFHRGEEANDFEFARFLSSLGEVYIHDAFADAHRVHASMVTLPKLLPSYAGLLMELEVENLSAAFDPPHPFLLILGGGKPDSKFHLIKKFLLTADHIFVGGAVANNFYQEVFGYEVGRSLYKHVTEDPKNLWGNGKISLPEEVVVQNVAGAVSTKAPQEVAVGDKILDAGPHTFPKLQKQIDEAQFILWNGPLGDYLIPGFEKGTIALMEMLEKSSARKIAGGGDTVSLIMKYGKESAFDFISTGGGAMLEFLAEGTLPGIEVLKK